MQTEIFPEVKPEQNIPLMSALSDMGPMRRRQFILWHREHRWVWKAVEKRFIAKASAGQMRIGLKEIFEELRQEYLKEDRTSNDAWKLNNNYTSIYARLIAYKYPELSSRLEMRRVKIKGGSV